MSTLSIKQRTTNLESEIASYKDALRLLVDKRDQLRLDRRLLDSQMETYEPEKYEAIASLSSMRINLTNSKISQAKQNIERLEGELAFFTECN